GEVQADGQVGGARLVPRIRSDGDSFFDLAAELASQRVALLLRIGQRLHVVRLFRLDAVHRFPVYGGLRTALPNDVRLGHGHKPVAVAGNGLVLRYSVTAGVAVLIFDVPPLRLQEPVSFDDSQDGAGSGGVIIRVPPEIEGVAHGPHKVAVAVNQRCDRGGTVEPDPVAVAPVVPTIEAIFVLRQLARGTPVVRVLARPLSYIGDDAAHRAPRVDGRGACIEDLFHIAGEERGRDHGVHHLRGLRGLAIDAHVRVVDADARRRTRHARRNEPPGLADELPREIEIGPGINGDSSGQRWI